MTTERKAIRKILAIFFIFSGKACLKSWTRITSSKRVKMLVMTFCEELSKVGTKSKKFLTKFSKHKIIKKFNVSLRYVFFTKMIPAGNSGKRMDTIDKMSVNILPVWSMGKFVSAKPDFL